MAKTDTTINIRVDKATKKEAQKTLEDMGMDISTGIKMFLRNVILTQSLPFEPRTKNGFTVRQEKQILEETKKTLDRFRKNKKHFASAKGLNDSILET